MKSLLHVITSKLTFAATHFNLYAAIAVQMGFVEESNFKTERYMHLHGVSVVFQCPSEIVVVV